MRFKYLILLLCFVLSFSDLFSQKIISDSIPENPISLNAFKNGEWFEFRVYYGVFNTSYISLKIDTDTINSRPVFHARGYGKTVGLARLFFKVEDYYESFFDQKNGLPYRFIRNINEGGYTKNNEIYFNHKKRIARVHDKKNNTKNDYPIKKNVQDLISAYYYLRSFYDTSKIKINQTIGLNMFFDNENYLFKLKFLGKEILETKFGDVECLKFRPYVQSGRVFKEQESVNLWISNDKNKLPVRLQADLAVGSIKCDLENFKNLNNPFNIQLRDE